MRKIGMELLSIGFKVILLVTLITNLVVTANRFNDRIPTPVSIVETVETVDSKIVKMEAVLKKLGCPEKRLRNMSVAVLNGAEHIDVDPLLIAALIRTESDFDMSAVSDKGYKGLMQTPVATKQWEDVDILIGCKILKEKLKIAKGDVRYALALYKGGNNPMAHRQAEQVVKLYKEIKGAG